MPQTFQPDEIECFHFEGFYYDEPSATARLRYRFDDRYRFEETIRFPTSAAPLSRAQRTALEQALRLLHLFAGISYYKAAIPPRIEIDTGPLDTRTAALVQTLYRHGLGEFAYRNGIRLHDRIHFPVDSDTHAPGAIELPLTNGPLVAVGGGKDSIVSIEAMRQGNEPVTLFSVGRAEPIRRSIEQADLPWLSVERKLSPTLFELNRRGALNGHVPVTAIVSMIAICTAIIHGHGAVVLSNERSASAGNLTLEDGFVVNHQYSKGLDFENALCRHVHEQITADLDYFSLLRPWSELAIARAFAGYEQYHPVFTSCNANFRINADAPPQRWCLDCPKCRFVFLALAPFIPREKIIAIFGGNLLDDETQLAGYDALLGIDAHKPFECVGEEAECAAALVLLSENPHWRDDLIVARFRKRLLPRIDDPRALASGYLSAAGEHNIPEKYLGLAHAALGT